MEQGGQKQIYYKYFSLEKFERFADYVVNEHLYGAKYEELNDPFEGRYNKTGLSDTQMRRIKNALGKIRICAMFKKKDSQNFPDNFLMWSHYANSHKGCCFEFEHTMRNNSNKWKVIDIIYDNKMPKPSDCSDDSVCEILSHKTKYWENENEARAVRKYDTKTIDSNPYYSIKLKAVYFGMKVPKKDWLLYYKIINKFHEDVKVYKIMKDKSFTTGNYPDLKPYEIVGGKLVDYQKC